MATSRAQHAPHKTAPAVPMQPARRPWVPSRTAHAARVAAAAARIAHIASAAARTAAVRRLCQVRQTAAHPAAAGAARMHPQQQQARGRRQAAPAAGRGAAAGLRAAGAAAEAATATATAAATTAPPWMSGRGGGPRTTAHCDAARRRCHHCRRSIRWMRPPSPRGRRAHAAWAAPRAACGPRQRRRRRQRQRQRLQRRAHAVALLLRRSASPPLQRPLPTCRRLATARTAR